MSVTKVTYSMIDGAFINPSDYGTLSAALNVAIADNNVVGVLQDTEVKVPSDAATLQIAFDRITPLNSQCQITVLIESGHEPLSGVSVSNGNYGQFVIESQDAEVTLSASFTGTNFIYGSNAVLPTLGCLINADTKCDNGYYADQGSSGVVLPNCGVKYVNQTGLYVDNGSRVTARSSDFTYASQGAGATASGILAWGSQIDAQLANVSNSGYYGAQAAAAGSLNFRQGTADNCVRHGIRATNGGFVNARSASAQNCLITGFRCYDGSVMHARNSNATGSDVGYWCEYSSLLNAQESTATDCRIGYFAASSSTINCGDSVANNCSDNVIAASEGSKVNANSLAGSSNDSRAISANNGSFVNINNGNVSCSANIGTLGATLVAQGGSKISAHDGTFTSTNTSIATATEGSFLSIKDATITYDAGSNAVTFFNGSLVTVHGTGITDADISGTLNTISSNGIVFG